MVRRRREKENQRNRRAEQRRVVDVLLAGSEILELPGEPNREQEAEQHLGTGNEGAELLKELTVLALESLLELLLVLLVLYPLLGVVVLGDDRDRILSARRRRATALDLFDAAIVGASDEDAKRAGLDAELEGSVTETGSLSIATLDAAARDVDREPSWRSPTRPTSTRLSRPSNSASAAMRSSRSKPGRVRRAD
jgi:hypothetical protein